MIQKATGSDLGVDLETDSANPNSRLNRRVSTIAMATALGIASSAPMAFIVDSGPVDLPVTADFKGLYLNLVTGASAGTPAPAGWDFNPFLSLGNLAFFTSTAAANNNQVVGAGTTVTALAAGATVGPASTYANAGVAQTFNTPFLSTGTNYVGIRFTNEATGGIRYGYVQIQTTAPTGFPANITRYVYDENFGQSVTIPAAPVFQGAVSRKVHGAAGTFDLRLSGVRSNPTTEPRQGPDLTVVFNFDKPMTLLDRALTISEGTATYSNALAVGTTIVMDFINVPDQQYLTINLTRLQSVDGATGGTASVRLGLLAGDVNQNGVVTLADLGLVNQQLAQIVTTANFLKDVNVSGTLSLADKGITNTKLTHSLPAP